MFPKIILLDNFNGCNLKCSICDHRHMRRPVKRMDISLYDKIITEIAEYDPTVRLWQIFFGDPFLCRDMNVRIEIAKNMGLQDVVLNTNGLLMTRERARNYITAGLDWMYVGIDAATKATYDKIRVGGDFDKVVENVLAWRKMKDNIFVQFVECDLNRHEKNEFIKFWNDHGVRVKIRPMVSWIGLVDNGKKDVQEQTEPCYWFKNSLSILNTGDIVLCACDIHGKHIRGEVAGSIRKAWEKHQAMGTEPCRACTDWEAASAEYHIGEKVNV